MLHRIQELGSVKLSEIDIGLSPSSVLIVLLHLANEYKVELTQLKDGDDNVQVRALF